MEAEFQTQLRWKINRIPLLCGGFPYAAFRIKSLKEKIQDAVL